ncbi:MAG: endonuclease/exonuclease/phosphatase family protein [Dysgonamonadaceae bacterium]|nr:endonuclease/exonuclease/phosphatase family protein [Dysgonamonadaceae bacterium]
MLNLLFACFFLIFKKWKTVFIYATVFFICWSAISTYFPIHFRTEKVPEGSIKLLTYNVMYFNGFKKNRNGVVNPILDYIKNSKADIVCIQEYGYTTDNVHLSKRDILNALKDLPYYHFDRFSAPTNNAYGIAIFSKYPFSKVEKLHYSSENNGSIMVDLDINGKRLTLINNHLESNNLSPEDRTGFYDLTRNLNSEKLENFTHLMHHRLTPAFKTRAKQAEVISEVISKSENPYIVVCGDFNDTPVSYVHHKISENLCDAFVETGFGPGITYNRHRFLFRIDHILHSKNIKAYNCTVGKIKTSDHYPVSCILKLD